VILRILPEEFERLNVGVIDGRIYEGRPLWSSGQSVLLHIPRSRVRFSVLPDFLERGPLSLVWTIKELLE
jgi:hypothetical protein